MQSTKPATFSIPLRRLDCVHHIIHPYMYGTDNDQRVCKITRTSSFICTYLTNERHNHAHGTSVLFTSLPWNGLDDALQIQNDYFNLNLNIHVDMWGHTYLELDVHVTFMRWTPVCACDSVFVHVFNSNLYVLEFIIHLRFDRSSHWHEQCSMLIASTYVIWCLLWRFVRFECVPRTTNRHRVK